MVKYRFQTKNRDIFDGNFEINIRDFVAEIKEEYLTSARKLVIEAHGGQLIEEKKPKPRKGKKEVTNDSSGT